jgi:hypothetical protein
LDVAYRHTSERIQQHYYERRANLNLVCIRYLYEYSVFKLLTCNFLGFRRAG